MTDQRLDLRIDALVRRLDIPAEPDGAFMDRTFAALLPIARDARRRDAQPFGRLRASLRLATQPQPAAMRRVMTMAALAVTLIALLGLLAFAIGQRDREQGGNGLLIISRSGELQALDTETGDIETVIPQGQPIIGVSRSPDGQLVAFWTGPDTGDRLDIADVDGGNRQTIVAAGELTRRGCVDAWSTDSRWLAADVTVADKPVTLVVNIESGVHHTLGPPDGVAECPLWSPDGRWLAFAHVADSDRRSLAVITVDGTESREISGDLGDLDVSGANSWSPDGAWIYFDAKHDERGHIYRAKVAQGGSTQLTGEDLEAYAPALSPDGSLVSFIVIGNGPEYDSIERWENARYDVYVMGADGTNPHLVLHHATNDGWSSDGSHVLAEWHPVDGASNGALVIVTPSGGTPEVVLPFDQPCGRKGAPISCVDGLGWGQPRP
jgi:Tol biopolymer transport system component